MAAKKGDDFNKDTSKSTHISSQKTDNDKENVDNDKENVVESMCGIDWGKSLEFLPTFTIKEIEKHRDASGKQKDQSVMKAMIRGRKLKEERFLSSDSVFTAKTKDHFVVKCQCQASMKKVLRFVSVTIDRKTGLVISGSCTCPAGKSGSCNHVMAILFELADYSLRGLRTVPKEKACTSTLRKWGVPGENSSHLKEPVMKTTVQKSVSKKGIRCTVYDPRLNINKDEFEKRTEQLQNSLSSIDKNIGFAHCIQPVSTAGSVKTEFGNFLVGSPLSYQLQPVEFNFKVLSNIREDCPQKPDSPDISKIDLPLAFIQESKVRPDWNLTNVEMSYLETNKISNEQSVKLEKETVGQSNNAKWVESGKMRITSSNAHKIFVRKRNHKVLATSLLNPLDQSQIPPIVQKNLNHGVMYEPVAREKYLDILKHQFQRQISLRETGLVIQPSLFWLAASPDGVICDNAHNPQIGLIEIKCPYSKHDYYPNDLLNDDKFYVGSRDGVPYLKPDHSNGYFSQIQMAMGLSQAKFCDFIVYTFKGMIIIRTEFEPTYFVELINKLNMFYKTYMLPELTQV